MIKPVFSDHLHLFILREHFSSFIWKLTKVRFYCVYMCLLYNRHLPILCISWSQWYVSPFHPLNKRYYIGSIGGLMVSVLTSSAVDPGFEPRSDQTKDYKIDICCFSAKHASLRRKSKDWLARNQDNVSEWSDMSIRGLLFQWVSTIKI